MSTVNYRYPVAGTVAPTAAQVADLSMVTAQVVMGDTDTQAIVTHNMAAAGFGAGYAFPLVNWRWATSNAPTGTILYVPMPTIQLTDSNTVTILKVSALDSGGTLEVAIQRPNTIIT
jgi:hypothetical protein